MGNLASDTQRPGAGLHDSVTSTLLEMISEHRPDFPDLDQIAARAGQDEAAVREMFGTVQEVLDTLAEQALVKLFDICVRTVTQAPIDDPVAQFRALGVSYLNWAFENQAQFRLVQHSKLVDIQGNENLARYIRSMQELMLRLLNTAQQSGRVDPQADIHTMLITGRCLLFGLARMGIDKNMTEWHPGKSPQDAAHEAFSDYMDAMARTGAMAHRAAADTPATNSEAG